MPVYEAFIRLKNENKAIFIFKVQCRFAAGGCLFMSWLDLAIIGIVVLGALLGLWRGFFKSVISLFGWLVSFIIAFFITKPIVGALLDAEKVKNFVVGDGSGWSLYS